MARTQIASNAFTQANGALDTSTNWLSHDNSDLVTTSLTVDTNRFLCPYSSITGHCTWKGAGTFSNDQYAGIAYSGLTTTSGDSVGVMVRSNSIHSLTGYRLRIYDYTPNLQLHKIVADTPTALDTRDVTLGTSGTLYLEVVGTTLYVYVNGSLVYSTTDNAIASGKPGITAGCEFGSGDFGDDFDAGDVTVASGGASLSGGRLVRSSLFNSPLVR
jgi:hypothetical protein